MVSKSLLILHPNKKQDMKITGYKTVSYNELQGQLQSVYADYRENKSEIELAVAINVKSPQTVRNAFQEEMQMVSDDILTKVMGCIGFTGFVMWKDGQRLYYVKNGKK